MKKLQVLFLTLFVSATAVAQIPSFAWAKKIASNQGDGIIDMAVDTKGNVISTGYYSGNADFDPGADTFELKSPWPPSSDIFVNKLDKTGKFVWAVSFDGTEDNQGNGIAVDAQGNILVCGIFSGSIDCDPGAGKAMLVSKGNSDAFVIKLDTAGKVLWFRQLGGAFMDEARGIVFDPSGNALITGSFEIKADFDPGSGVVEVGADGKDIFVCKLDVDGNYKFAMRMGGESNDFGNGIATDVNGIIYTTGEFYKYADFDPGSSDYFLSADGNSKDIFVSKLSPNGAFLWAKKMGGNYDDYGVSLAIDGSGNVITTGFFHQIGDFDPGDPIKEMITGSRSTFVSKLDAGGNYVWAKAVGSNMGEVFTLDMALDHLSDIYLTGYYSGMPDMDPGPSIHSLPDLMDNTIFTCKFDGAGSYKWSYHNPFTNAWGCESHAICVDGAMNIYTGGTFSGDVDFNPGSGTNKLSTGDDYSIFICKLGQPNAARVMDQNPVQFSILPNPVSGILSCRVAGALDLIKLEIFNYSGQLVFSSRELNEIEKIDVSGYSPGAYQIIVHGRNRSYSQQFLKE